MENDNSIPVAEEMVFHTYLDKNGRGCAFCHFIAFDEGVSLEEAARLIYKRDIEERIPFEDSRGKWHNSLNQVWSLANSIEAQFCKTSEEKAHYIRLIYRAGKVPRYVSDGTVIALPAPQERIQSPSPTPQELKPTYMLDLAPAAEGKEAPLPI